MPVYLCSTTTYFLPFLSTVFDLIFFMYVLIDCCRSVKSNFSPMEAASPAFRPRLSLVVFAVASHLSVYRQCGPSASRRSSSNGTRRPSGNRFEHSHRTVVVRRTYARRYGEWHAHMHAVASSRRWRGKIAARSVCAALVYPPIEYGDMHMGENSHSE